DAKRLYKQENAYGLLALSWLAILPIMMVSMLYKNLLTAPGIGICFWYYCGVIVAVAGRTSKPLTAPHAVPLEGKRHSTNAGMIRPRGSRGDAARYRPASRFQ